MEYVSVCRAHRQPAATIDKGVMFVTGLLVERRSQVGGGRLESLIFLRNQAFLRAELRILQPWNRCRLSSRLRYSRLRTQRSVLVEAYVTIRGYGDS